MGLPQVSTSKIADEVTASLSTFAQSPPHFGGISTCDLDGLEGTGSSATREFPCSSLEFQRKASLEQSKGSGGQISQAGITDGASKMHTIRIDNSEWHSPKYGSNMHTPISRIVGFDNVQIKSVVNGCENVVFERNRSVVESTNVGGSADLQALHVRKRLLSPLNGMLLADKFGGDPLDIAGDGITARLSSSNDCKKANFGNDHCLTTATWPTSTSDSLENMLESRKVVGGFLTDGPLLDNKISISAGDDDICGEESCGRGLRYGVSIPWKKVASPPLSLSPLGPNWSDRMKSAGKSHTYTLQDERLMDGKIPSMLHEDDEFYAMNNLHQGLDMLQKDLGHSPEIFGGSFNGWHCGSDCTLSPQSPQRTKFIRSLSGLAARRSLVGSFEESLLSGRLSSGKYLQVNHYSCF